ncbi:NRDE protein-domain-containing protein [Talaromyces proteolyticus]|uniref:NRDE protein-domain-containing protein n=1 Tax=Talaromyces proteolyticus TaxID=1131652 RepID=A0AAD4KZV3_9EURO|nr:NRDE protein-domain-containing protein [Talaromyces proteolyticus]KAH8703658.1 NRDE protein-domain-containing protein [Talaromyces proteolyticus]
MCIALISTAHPSYPLIIIDNRDEYLHRPTAPAGWWQEPNNHVLGSRDLARPEQGTWMGVTKQGRVAVLTNYRENVPIGTVSRGAIVNAFLTEPPATSSSPPPRSTRQFVVDTIENQVTKKAGGFSLVCGKLDEPLAIISNRMSDDVDRVTWIAKEKGETVGLSNTFFSDRTWPKIINGEKLMKNAIAAHVQAAEKNAEGEEDLIRRLFEVLSTDTLPRLNCEPVKDEYQQLLKQSIFIPLLGDRAKFEAEMKSLEKLGLAGYVAGLYGTQKQTILLVDPHGRVKYVERTLYDQYIQPIPLGTGDLVFEFNIEK